MSSPAESSSVDRRLLLRGGAVLAGATVLAAAGRTPEAAAADGDELLIGRDNVGATTTKLASAPASTDATLALENATGPTLRLLPAEDNFEDGDLQPGDIVNTDLGPLIGVDYGDGPQVDILATGADLDLLPTPVVFPPERLLDTRTARGRDSIVGGSSDNPLTAAGKLRAGQWIDVAVDAADGPFVLSAVFANLTAVAPEGNGYAVVYLSGTARPETSTLNYRTGQDVANAVFAGLTVLEDEYVVRIYTARTSHLLLDVSGVVALGAGGAGSVATTASARKAGGTRSGRVQRQAKQAARIKDSLRRR